MTHASAGYGHGMKTFREGRRPARPRNPPRWPDPVALIDWAQGAKTVLAGVLAWVVATDVLGLEQPFLAPWAAVLVVHATVYRTVSRGGQQVVATFLGVFLAWAAGALFGVGPLGMGVMLAASVVVGRVRWLGEEAITIATTGIVVLATNAIDESQPARRPVARHHRGRGRRARGQLAGVAAAARPGRVVARPRAAARARGGALRDGRRPRGPTSPPPTSRTGSGGAARSTCTWTTRGDC